MANIKQMFPRRYMSHEDLTRGEMYNGTIKAVVLIQARARPGGFGQPGMPGAMPPTVEEPEWALQFHEWPKPMRLKVSKANLIAYVVGSEETDHWIGRKIQFYRGQVDIGGRPQECILIDQTPLPVGPALAASTATGFKPTGKRVPREAVERFRDTAESLGGKKWDDFLAWLKRTDAAGLSAAFGTALDDLDAGLIPLMKRYLDELHKEAAGNRAPAPSQLPPSQPRQDWTTVGNKPESVPVRRIESGPLAGAPIGEEDIPF